MTAYSDVAAEPAKGFLCKRRLWLHKWTRWHREQVTTQAGEVVLWTYRHCLRCGFSQSASSRIARGVNSFPKYLR
jgi:hypothetical protein